MKKWIEKEFGLWTYYNEDDGRIIGVVHKLGTGSSTVWLAKMYKVSNFNHEELFNGQYIDSDHAKRSVENYWDIQGRTLIENEVL